MKELSLKSVRREAIGKGQARSLRREGMIPAILYGPDIEPIKLSVGLAEIKKIIKTSKAGRFLLNLNIDDGSVKKVTIKELQRRPVSLDILHIDFYEVAMDRKIKVFVPINTVGISKGVELGGMLQIVRREIEVFCLPDNIPDSIVIDVSDLDIGDSFHSTDLSLTDGVKIFGDSNYTILTVLNQKSTEEEGSDEELLEKESEESEVL